MRCSLPASVRWTVFTLLSLLLLSASPCSAQAVDQLIVLAEEETSSRRHPPSGSTEQDVLAAVQINGRLVSDSAILLRRAGRYYAAATSFAEWRLKPPPDIPMQLHGEAYFPLDGLSARFDPEQQILFLTVPAARFAETVFEASERDSFKPTPTSPGAFFNHDFRLTGAGGRLVLSGLAEVGFFSRAGILTTRLAGRDLSHTLRPQRLDSQLVRDFPLRRSTLTLGDAITDADVWSRQVNFAGLRWASNYSTQPSFVPIALPSLSGVAAQPSTADVYVNNIRMLAQPLDTGPFTVRNIPVVTPEGEIRMVITDVLGRQQVISASYLSVQKLLRKSVSAYSYQAGVLRRDFGTANSSYGTGFLSASHRRGLTDSLTVNGLVELLARSQTFGAGVDYGLLRFGLIGGGVALSHSDAGAGELFYIQAQHRSGTIDVSGNLQAASKGFRQLGFARLELPSKITSQLLISRAAGSRGSVSFGYFHREDRRSPIKPENLEFNGITTSAGVRLGRSSILSFSTNYSPDVRHGLSLALNLLKPLGIHRLLTTGTQFTSGVPSSTVELSQQLPTGTGFGYRLRGDLQSPDRLDAGFSYQNDQGIYDFEMGRGLGHFDWRMGENGSLVLFHRHVIPSRWINGSFGLVEVPATPGIKVYANNQYIGQTGRNGLLMVPILAPYDRNVLRLDDSGVPISVSMELGEKSVVPMFRSGVFARFSAAESHGALFTLLTPEGDPVPLGAQVVLEGDRESYAVALHGEVYVPNVSFPASLRARWDQAECVAFASAPSVAIPLPRIGPLTCRPGPAQP